MKGREKEIERQINRQTDRQNNEWVLWWYGIFAFSTYKLSIGWHVDFFMECLCIIFQLFLYVCGWVFYISISLKYVLIIDEIWLGKFGISWVQSSKVMVNGEKWYVQCITFLFYITLRGIWRENNLWWEYDTIGIVWCKLNAIITVPISIGVMLVLLFGFGEVLLQKRICIW